MDAYSYAPSLPAAVVAGVLFTLAFIGNAVQTLRFKSSVWTIMLLGVGMEAVGYIIRCKSTQDVYDQNLYVAQFLLIFLAPVLMAAACYILFGRVVFHIVPREARTFKLIWIPPRFVTPIFVTADILALILQLVGAAMFVTVDAGDENAASDIDKGRTIAQIGVAVQLVFFGFFTIIAVRFNFIARRFDAQFKSRISQKSNEKYVTIDGGERKLKKSWPALLRVTNIACAGILIRSIYRMVEFSLGKDGYIETHEWTQYVFDALMIIPTAAMFAWFFPGKYLPHLGFRKPKSS